MSTLLVERKVFVSVLLLALVLPPMALATSDDALTNENILALLRWKTKPQEIVAVIEGNATRFDLSDDSLSKLREAGVTAEVLEAMFKAKLKTSSGRARVAEPETRASGSVDPSPQDSEPNDTAPPPKPHTQARLDEAQNVVTRTVVPDLTADNLKPPPDNERCPFSEEESVKDKAKKSPLYKVDLDWKTGSISRSCVDNSGKYCFALHNANNILYTYSFTVNRIEPQGSDIDLLKDAMSKVKAWFEGAAAQKATPETKTALKPCPLDLRPAAAAAAALNDALAQLEPGKDANGKPTSVPLDTTLAKWQGVPGKFKAFEKAILDLFTQIKKLDSTQRNTCESELAAAEAFVLDVLVPARELFLRLASKVNSQHIAYFTAELDSTNAYDVVVKEFSGSQQTSADAKTFHLNACRKILVSSAGFLLTQLQARSYSSVTVPDKDDPTKTQNVLGVDGGGRPRTALMALLNYNLPWQPWRNVGFSISAGPVFDITNGNADTSRFGFFGGGSLHLWNRLFLTPGVHVGEFADFPQGFGKPGDPIPPDTGTPTPVKRYTARFALGISFKVGELGFGGGGTDNSTKKPAASQPK
ncbi:MAG: hypothetical protein WAU45_20665 [Blastocatellia bacterium]